MSGEAERPLRVAAVGDVHAHKSPTPELRALFAEIAQAADALCLCGDLTSHGLPEEAEVLAADLGTMRIPVVAVLGNHDLHAGRGDEVRRALSKVGVMFLDDEPREIGGVGFAGVKGFGGGFGNHMLGPFGEDMTKQFATEAVNEALALENALKGLKPARRVVVLHYSPVIDTVRGEPEQIFPFLGCSRLAETIDRFEVSAVFHGHAHHGAAEGRTAKGVPVYNCAWDLLKRSAPGPGAGNGAGRGFVVVEV